MYNNSKRFQDKGFAFIWCDSPWVPWAVDELLTWSPEIFYGAELWLSPCEQRPSKWMLASIHSMRVHSAWTICSFKNILLFRQTLWEKNCELRPQVLSPMLIKVVGVVGGMGLYTLNMQLKHRLIFTLPAVFRSAYMERNVEERKWKYTFCYSKFWDKRIQISNNG